MRKGIIVPEHVPGNMDANDISALLRFRTDSGPSMHEKAHSQAPEATAPRVKTSKLQLQFLQQLLCLF
jgi:hypothetical protein